jgi:hypothetical protein
MLDALKSPSERDYDRERESRSGTDIVRSSPHRCVKGGRDIPTITSI